MKSPTTDPSLRKMVNGIRRQLFRPARSRAPLDLEILEEAFKLIEGGGRLQDWRTLCRLNLKFYGMLQWAEVSALQMEDIRFDTTGMVLHIKRSKTDQMGKRTYVRINITDLDHCPVEITRLYMQKLNYGTENGYLQPQVRTYKNGEQSGVWYKKLSYSKALEDTKAFMAILGRNPADFGEHSGRRGGATAALEAGVSWIDLKRHGRWASDSAPQRYIEETKKKANVVASALAQSATRRQDKQLKLQGAASKEEYMEWYQDKGNRVAEWQEQKKRKHRENTAVEEEGERKKQSSNKRQRNEVTIGAPKLPRPAAAKNLAAAFTNIRPQTVTSKTATEFTTPRRTGRKSAAASEPAVFGRAPATAAFKPPGRIRIEPGVRGEPKKQKDNLHISPDTLWKIFEDDVF